ncbi:hypothetical protein ACGFZR_24650 [Streptomyces sp. NPDC048241]|uniref:hypothetical protein n=1 Tax=Streptomyces sp. NPDC048241 TaxID=3365521 RepID=UPI003723A057
MSEPEIPEALASYLATRDSQRAQAVRDFLALLTDRERGLVRDFAVMGYVHGRMHPEGEPHPKDSHVLATVTEACLHHRDLYPAVSAVASAATA